MNVNVRTAMQWWLSGALVLGGSLVMAGASQPWLTLYAGLQTYSGTIGVNGWIAFTSGAIALVTGIVALRATSPLLRLGSSLFGVAILGFSLWLLAGLIEIIHGQNLMMFVPRAGPGLFMMLAGAALIILAPIFQRTLSPTSMHR